LLTQLDAPQRESLCLAVRIPPAPGPVPPSPYCRWQDRYSAAYLRESVQQRLAHLGVARIGLLQLQTWTRAWNDDPQPLLVLRRLREEGRLGLVGVCPAEHDQDSVIQLMRDGLVDVVQIVFNLFHQEPAAQLLSVAAETGTGVIVRDVLDHGVLTGRYAADHAFAEDDVRRDYFAGDRLQRCAQRVQPIADDLRRLGLADRYTLADAALKFALQQQAVSSVIVGMRGAPQVQQITAAAALPDLPEQAIVLRRHNWRRGLWAAGK
jgi:aryl-alcohol dehydrogenase-like predicted oxidoreductase